MFKTDIYLQYSKTVCGKMVPGEKNLRKNGRRKNGPRKIGPREIGVRKNDPRKIRPRKNVLQKLFSGKRMLGNLNDFFIFID